MDAARSNTTRLLCARAWQAASFRGMLLRRLRHPSRATAPEPGVDLGLVARVCQYASRRETRFRAAHLLTLLLASALFLTARGKIPAGLIVLGTFAVTGVIQFVKVFSRRRAVARLFRKDRFDPEAVARLACAELDPSREDGLPDSGQNLVVYSNTPFTGAGTHLCGWSFAASLDRGRENFRHHLAPQTFTIEELYERVQTTLDQLELPGLECRDYLFVHGSEIRDDRRILPDVFGRPLQRVEDAVVQDALHPRSEHLRNYKWIRVHGWGSDVVVSLLFRCSMPGHTLFVEGERYVLAPLEDKVQAIDRQPPVTWKSDLLTAAWALVTGPFAALWSILELLGEADEAASAGLEEGRVRRAISRNPRYDYGAEAGVRETLAGAGISSRFQQLDADRFIKIVEREILDTLGEFLEEHNIDSTELRDRAMTIQSAGVLALGEAQSLPKSRGSRFRPRAARRAGFR
jgi:hypothetical protein